MRKIQFFFLENMLGKILGSRHMHKNKKQLRGN
jgi:hypothetical protein